jgi:hypothetical protein
MICFVMEVIASNFLSRCPVIFIWNLQWCAEPPAVISFQPLALAHVALAGAPSLCQGFSLKSEIMADSGIQRKRTNRQVQSLLAC